MAAMKKTEADDFANPLVFFFVVAVAITGILIFAMQLGSNRLLDAPPVYFAGRLHLLGMLLLGLIVVILPVPLARLTAGDHPPIPGALAVLVAFVLLAFFSWQI